MGIELQYLAWSIVLGVVLLLWADVLVTHQRGLAWNSGNREDAPAPLRGMAGRSDRAFRNFLETFPLLAAAVVGVLLSERAGPVSALGVQIYFWGRVAHAVLYVAGVRYLRSVAWVISVIGFCMVLWPLLAG